MNSHINFWIVRCDELTRHEINSPIHPPHISRTRTSFAQSPAPRFKIIGFTKPQWCNIGEGAVEKSFLTNLKKSSFTGPLCQHQEYPLGTGAEMIANFKRDLGKLREWLSDS